MKIKCPACGQVLSIPESAAGKIVKCPCGKQLRAPGAAAPASPKAASPAGGRPGGPAGAPAGSATRPPGARPGMGGGDFDPAMFDELTDEDLKPVKGITNPYSPVAAPTGGGGGKLLHQYAPAGSVGGKREIAGVGSRIVGAIIDGFFVNGFAAIGGGVAVVMLTSAGEEPPPATLGIAMVIIGIAVLVPVIINAVLIAKSGQSLGKKIVGTRMVDQETYQPAGLVQGFLIRSFVFGILLQLPIVGFVVAIADIVYLFSENHQTLHDKLAKTLVVKA